MPAFPAVGCPSPNSRSPPYIHSSDMCLVCRQPKEGSPRGQKSSRWSLSSWTRRISLSRASSERPRLPHQSDTVEPDSETSGDATNILV